MLVYGRTAYPRHPPPRSGDFSQAVPVPVASRRTGHHTRSLAPIKDERDATWHGRSWETGNGAVKASQIGSTLGGGR